MTDTPSQPPLFVGNFISLRHITTADAFLYHQWLQNPVFLAYKPYLKYLCSTPLDLMAHLAMQAQSNPRTEFEVLVIQQRTQEPIGIISLASIDEFNKKAEFSAGFISGYGTRCILEAIHAGIALSFVHYNLHKLIFYVTPNNHRALKIMQRYGFISEGCFKEEILIDEKQRVDLLRFALMKSTWLDKNFQQHINRIAPISL